MKKDESNIVLRVINGESVESIAFKENITIANIIKACKKQNIPKSHIKTIKQQAIARCVQEGKTRAFIESNFSVRLGFIQESCEKHGVAFEPFGLKSERSFQILAALINTNKSLVEIATDHGVSVATISDFYRMSIKQELPVVERRAGSLSTKKKYKIAFSFDDFLTTDLESCRDIIGIVHNVAEIHFIGFSEAYGEHEIRSRLNCLNIRYDGVFSVDQVEEFINKNNYRFFFGSDDGEICGIDSKTHVIKVRDQSNFDFQEKVWVYDAATGVQA